MDISLEPVGVGELLTETVQLMAPAAANAGVTLHYQPKTADRLEVVADRRRLRQVLLNLLSNAIKYNRRGGRVDIRSALAESSWLDIVVSDTGRGIREEDLPRVFIPFDRSTPHPPGSREPESGSPFPNA